MPGADLGVVVKRMLMAAVVLCVTVFVSSGQLVTANVAREIVLENDETRSVSLKIERIAPVDQDTETIYVLVCAPDASNCTLANRADSAEVLRYDCIAPSGAECRRHDATISDYFEYPFASTSAPVNWRPNSPLKSGILPAGQYRVRVFINDGSVDVDSFNRLFSFPQYSFTANTTPTIQGTPLVGSKLQLTTPTWSPTPADITYQWMRCSKQVSEVLDFSQVDPYPYTFGYKSGGTADCYLINEDGSFAEPTIDNDGPGALSVRAQATTGFTSYTLRDADIGSFVTARITVSNNADLRDYGLASTAVIEKKTAPINQVAPKIMLKKTKKIKKLQVGATITVNSGTWKWSDTISYQWYNCSKRLRTATTINTKQCTAIKRATKVNYKMKRNDRGRFLAVQLIARNELGETTLVPASTAKLR